MDDDGLLEGAKATHAVDGVLAGRLRSLFVVDFTANQFLNTKSHRRDLLPHEYDLV